MLDAATLIIAALLALLATPRARALDPDRSISQTFHRIWQLQQGLPQASIGSLLQTQDGYLWLGTDSSLLRFDGVRFTSPTVLEGPPLTDVRVRDLREDVDHALFIATDGAGLLRLRDGVVTRWSLREGLPSESVAGIAFDGDTGVWACTPAGLARLAGGRIEVLRAAQGLGGDDVRAVCEARDGLIWAGGDGAWISSIDGAKVATRRLASVPSATAVEALLSSDDGALWVGTGAGLVRVTKGEERLFTRADGLADDRITCLSRGSDGCLWVGTRDGFSRVRGGEIDSFRASDGLSQSTVHALCEDREGSLWVGTKHGLNQFIDRRLLPFTASEGLPSNDAGPVFQDAEGSVWVGTIGAGLSRFDGHRFASLTRAQGLPGDSIFSLCDDGAGALWVGTERGLAHLRDGRVDRALSSADGLPSNLVHCLLRDRRGALWIGTAEGAATLVDGRVTPIAGPRAAVLALFERGDGTILLATAGGVYQAESGRLQAFSRDPLALRDVDSFFEDQDGLLWMGTLGGGLRLQDGARTVSFSVRDGLFDDEIFGIAADGDGRLWMACSKGIFSVSREDLRRRAAGAAAPVQSTPYSPTDAQRTVECKPGVQPCALRMRDGRIWFSTIHGVIVVDLPNLRKKMPPLPVLIEEVVVNGQSEQPAAIADLPPGRKNIEIRYTAFGFQAPTRITFRHRLDGFDPDWVDAGARREATYTNLPPGSYRFRVAATNIDGAESEALTSVEFTLAPHFYQRVWFVPMLVATLAAAAWLVYRWRVRNLNERHRDVLAERSRIARELHDTLLQGFSGVTMEMQALSGRLLPGDAQGKLAEIIGDAAECMKEARRSLAGLRKEQGAKVSLSVAIETVARQLVEGRGVRLALELAASPRALPPDVEYNVLRIAQEAVSNAVRHAHARSITVTLSPAPGRLRLSVTDDGAGFEIGGGTQPGHYGIVGMRERAAQIGASVEIESVVAKGTTVRVIVP